MEWEKREKLGEILLAEGVITVGQLRKALRKQKETDMRLGEVLISLGLISEERLLHYIGEQLGIPNVRLGQFFITDEVLSLLGEDFIISNEVLPLFLDGDSLHCTMVDPLDTDVIEKIKSKARLPVEVSICSRKDMLACTALHFPESGERTGIDVDNGLFEAGRFLRGLLMAGSRREMYSEVLIEQREERVNIRVGGGGTLRSIDCDSLKITRNLLNGIKKFFKVDGNGSNPHQETEEICDLQFGKEIFSTRVSVLRTTRGESLAMKLVPQNLYMRGLFGIGLSESEKQLYRDLLNAGRGLLLVASPPGNGKTVTMYAMLKYLADEGKTTYLLEDSPLGVLGFTHQIRTTKTDVRSLGTWLDRVMKHSPDAVAVGECNDTQTLLTLLSGPANSILVISTIQASDCPDAWFRLRSLSVDPVLLSRNLVGIASQRMVKPSRSPVPLFHVVKLDSAMRAALESNCWTTSMDD